MLVTDLSSTEIILGKLGARLAPVFALSSREFPSWRSPRFWEGSSPRRC